ncbi:inactive dipeptidyl peptidase 10-like isoform X2 [Glandiceps talaboti]
MLVLAPLPLPVVLAVYLIRSLMFPAVLRAASSGSGPSGSSRRKDDESKELVGSNPTQRNWRGIIIALLVIVIIISCVAIAVKLSTPAFHTLEKFTFEDAFNPDLKPRIIAGEWVVYNDYDYFVYRDDKGDLIRLDARANESYRLLENRTLSDHEVTRYSLSPSSELQTVLLATKEKQVYRHSFLAIYIIYDTSNKERMFLNPPEVHDPEQETYIQYAAWSPQGDLVFVYENNIYYQDITETEVRQVTADGVPNVIFHGIPDWLYEEEILSTNNAIWWSSDGAYFCFLTFNDTDVREANYMKYDYKVYADVVDIPYPKAGAANNPIVALSIYNTKLKTILPVYPPDELADQDHYFMALSWPDNNRFAVVWSNRLQTHSIVVLCQADTGSCSQNFEYEMSHGWLLLHPPVFTQSGGEYFTKLPRKQGNKGDFKHLAKITAPGSGGGSVDFVTDGTWDVDDILGADEDLKRVYFTSTEMPSPRSRHLWYVDLDSNNEGEYERHCMSCNVTNRNCSFLQPLFSKTTKFYALNCLGPDLPQSTLHSSEDFALLYVFEDNSKLAQKLEGKAVPKKIYLEIPTEGYENPGMYAELTLPAKMDNARKHPLLIDVYGGPGTQKVQEIYSLGWPAYLSSQYNVIVASIDGRGAGFYGDKFMFEVYKQLGSVDIEDQVTGANHIKDLKYIDNKRAAIWGWSYGGFASAMALANGGDTFTCAMAVAPVTDWRYYDSAYTERYMHYPEENELAYMHANVSAKAENFVDKSFLLVHGLADDNVHFQHSANLMKALIEYEVDFKMQFYTDKAHDLSGQHTRKHLYRLLTNHLQECLNLKD